MSMLVGLIGQTVKEVSDDVATYIPINSPETFPEGGQAVLVREIIFQDYKLTVANPMRLTQTGAQHAQLTVLLGKTVYRVEENEGAALIDFGNDLQLEVDLREESFSGPEAMVLHGPNGFIVVWN